MNISAVKHKVHALEARLTFTKEKLSEKQASLSSLQDHYSLLSRVQTILKQIALETQNQLSYELSTIATSSLESIFPEPYEFIIQFIEKRNKTEIDYELVKEHLSLGSPLQSTGGGIADIISFSLRIACMIISNSEPLLILDEPMKNLSRNYQPDAGKLLQKLATSLDIQFLIISHDTAIIEQLDANTIIIN